MPRSFLVKKREKTRTHVTHFDESTTHLETKFVDLMALKDDEKPTYCDPDSAVPGMCGPHRSAVSVASQPGIPVVTPYTPVLHPLALRLSQGRLRWSVS